MISPDAMEYYPTRQSRVISKSGFDNMMAVSESVASIQTIPKKNAKKTNFITRKKNVDIEYDQSSPEQK